MCFVLQKPNKHIYTSKIILFKPLGHVGHVIKAEIDEILDTPFKKKKHPENHTLSGRTSPLRSHKGVAPGVTSIVYRPHSESFWRSVCTRKD